jgi:hypothetical protein
MIADALDFVRRNLDAHLRTAMDSAAADPTADRVVFIDGEQMDPPRFKPDAVTALLVNVEEERVLRPADPYLRRGSEGQALRVQPDIRLVLHLALVASFRQYELSWTALSRIIEHLQSLRVFDAESTPGLPAGIDRLTAELATLSLPEQSSVWSALRVPMRPAVHYRLRLLTFRDASASESPAVTSAQTSVKRLS